MSSTVVRQALEAQEYWRLKGLKADLVILNEHPVSYLDEVQSRLTALLDEGPWRMWKHQPGGAFLLRADTMGRAERDAVHGGRRMPCSKPIAATCARTWRGRRRRRLPRRRCRRSRIADALHPPA